MKFAEPVKDRPGGAIVVDVKYGGQLGKGEKEVVEQVQFGALDMARISIAPVTEFVPELEAFGLPYIWQSRDHMVKVLNGDTGQRLLKNMENYKFYGLAYYESGARSFYNSKREVKTVADLKGLKIRVQKSKLMIDLVNTMGANATPISFGEVYDAISKGVIDGAENNWPSYESTGHYEVAKYYTLDTHTSVPEILVASKAAFDKKLNKNVDIQVITQLDKIKQGDDPFLSNINLRNNSNITSRFCLIDDKEALIMLVNDKETHPTSDTAIWIKSPFFVSSLNNLFDLLFSKK